MSELIDFNELKAANVLPSPKDVRLRVMRLCQQENVSLNALAQQIQADPIVAGRIIKIANSVNPNKNRPIASITTDVLILVGIASVRQVVLGISLVAEHRTGICKNFAYSRFWSRSAAMACAAQSLGENIRVAPVAEMFTCGLLAGIGSLGLASARPTAYSDLIIQWSPSQLREMTQAETSLFGYNHLTLAAAMMADWNIPRLFIDAVQYHETPAQFNLEPGSRQWRLTLMLHLAGKIADLFVATDDEKEDILALIHACAVQLELETERLCNAINIAAADWHDWGAILQIETRPFTPMAGDAFAS